MLYFKSLVQQISIKINDYQQLHLLLNQKIHLFLFQNSQIQFRKEYHIIIKTVEESQYFVNCYYLQFVNFILQMYSILMFSIVITIMVNFHQSVHILIQAHLKRLFLILFYLQSNLLYLNEFLLNKSQFLVYIIFLINWKLQNQYLM